MDQWKVEKRFREWGKVAYDDDFAGWAYETKLEAELRDLFMEDLSGRDTVVPEE
jgi:hypothetical protein